MTILYALAVYCAIGVISAIAFGAGTLHTALLTLDTRIPSLPRGEHILAATSAPVR